MSAIRLATLLAAFATSALASPSLPVAVETSPSPQSNALSYFPIQWDPIDMAAASAGGSGVTDVAVLSNGDVWVGTHRGLARFAYGRWEVYKSGKGRLPDNDVTQLIAERGQTLWSLTETGIASVSGTSWKEWDTSPIVSPSRMCQSRQGGVWVIGSKTTDSSVPSLFLMRIGPHPLSPVKVSFQNETEEPAVLSFAELQDGEVWVGTTSGVFTVDTSGKATKIQRLTEMGQVFVSSIRPVSDGTIWMGTDKGLWSLTARGLRKFDMDNSPLPSKDIVDLKEDRDGSLWIVTKKWEPFTGLLLLTIKLGEYSVAHLTGQTWEVFTHQNSGLPDQEISNLVLDRNGMWIGTATGLVYGQRSRWSILNLLQKPGEEFKGIKQAADGSLWVLTNDTLEVITSGGARKVIFDVDPRQVGGSAIALSPDRKRIWVTFGDELYYFDIGSAPVAHKIEGIDSFINQDYLAVAHDGSIIFSGNFDDGVFTIKDGRMTELGPVSNNAQNSGNPNPSFLDDTKISDVSSILADPSRDRLIVGTRHGVYISLNGQWTHYDSHSGALPSETVTSLAFDNSNELWIGTDGGLSHLDANGAISTITSNNSFLPSNAITSISFDSLNGIWIGTSRGLAHVRDGRWQIYDAANSKLAGGIHVLEIASDGSLWFAERQSGLAHFRAPERTSLTVELANKAESIEEPTHTFGIMAFDSTFQAKPESLRYHWTLFSTNWSHLSEKQVQDVYTSLPFENFALADGSYKVQVTAVDRYGFESDPATQSFVVTLREGLWKKILGNVLKSATAFYVLSFIALLLMIPFYWRFAWIRTAINSGVFTKYSLLHKSILNSHWSRRKILTQAVQRLVAKATVPTPYIEQYIAVGTGEALLQSAADASKLLERIFLDTNSAIIIGKSGSGKSVLMRHLFQDCAERFVGNRSAYVPLFLNLRTDWVAGLSITDMVANALRGVGVELSSDVIAFMVGKGNFLLLVDSLNEVDSAGSRSTLLPFLASNGAARILIASQRDSIEQTHLKICRLSIVSADQAREYIFSTTGKDLWPQLPKEAQRLAENPQNLMLLTETLNSGFTDDMPLHRADLYRSILDRDTAMSGLRLLGGKNMLAVYHLVLTMIEDVRYSLTADEVLDLVVRDVADGELVLQYLRRSRLFNEEQRRNAAGILEEVLSFTHETMGKFLASRYLKEILRSDHSEVSSRISELVGCERLEESFRFTVDELQSKGDLDRLARALLLDGSSAALSILAYMITTKEVGRLDGLIVDSYARAQAALQLKDMSVAAA